jgi:hypothetical protein
VRGDIFGDSVPPLTGLEFVFRLVPGTYVPGYYVPSSGLRSLNRRRRLIPKSSATSNAGASPSLLRCTGIAKNQCPGEPRPVRAGVNSHLSYAGRMGTLARPEFDTTNPDGQECPSYESSATQVALHPYLASTGECRGASRCKVSVSAVPTVNAGFDSRGEVLSLVHI